ncbi:hypothetical protein OQA88_7400 [Cercophora sp. LCS_1]
MGYCKAHACEKGGCPNQNAHFEDPRYPNTGRCHDHPHEPTPEPRLYDIPQARQQCTPDQLLGLIRDLMKAQDKADEKRINAARERSRGRREELEAERAATRERSRERARERAAEYTAERQRSRERDETHAADLEAWNQHNRHQTEWMVSAWAAEHAAARERSRERAKERAEEQGAARRLSRQWNRRYAADLSAYNQSTWDLWEAAEGRLSRQQKELITAQARLIEAATRTNTPGGGSSQPVIAPPAKFERLRIEPAPNRHHRRGTRRRHVWRP